MEKLEKVLIVDDEADVREALATALSGAGFEVLTASNGKDAVPIAHCEHPVVILMDINMPEMNGHEAVAKIREDLWGKDAKVIFLTAFSDPENIVSAVKAGSEDYIVKGDTSLTDIVAKVKQVQHGY